MTTLETTLPGMPPEYDPDSIIYTAYNRCVDWERRLIESQNVDPAPKGTYKPPNLAPWIKARLLGALILHAPDPESRFAVSEEICRCHDDVALGKLAQLYMDCLLRCFRKYKGRTPSTSFHPSMGEFDEQRVELESGIVAAPTDHRTAKSQALCRDNYRCIISGVADKTTFREAPGRLGFPTGDFKLAQTQCAHIFPESLVDNFDKEGRKIQWVSNVWTVMARFGRVDVDPELNGINIHRLENVMTMTTELHDSFDTLQVWLEETDIVNRYNVQATHPAYLCDVLQTTVTFVSTNPKLRLPNPKYLRLHAACCKVAHLSGAGEYIDEFYRGMEETRVLANDGTSADYLSFTLMQAGVRVH